MKAVLISIKPGWNNLIELGKKTLEVRKNAPNIPTLFTVYIYETKDNGRGRGAVTSEFVCDCIRCAGIPYPAYQNELDPLLLAESCVRYYDLHRYAYHDDLCFWHISELKIYDEPKELSAFKKACDNDLYCESCAMFRKYEGDCGNAALQMKRPPQSWCYVEEASF